MNGLPQKNPEWFSTKSHHFFEGFLGFIEMMGLQCNSDVTGVVNDVFDCKPVFKWHKDLNPKCIQRRLDYRDVLQNINKFSWIFHVIASRFDSN